MGNYCGSIVTYDSDDQSDKPGQEGFRSKIANSICFFEEGRTALCGRCNGEWDLVFKAILSQSLTFTF